uniref:Uncharacterized protein n=1 Tax=Tetraselmis sp. GSL018 TaxID=582737 RepID=A0A061RKV7_9CHLO
MCWIKDNTALQNYHDLFQMS